jgi:Protein of unknown function (DUF1059)
MLRCECGFKARAGDEDGLVAQVRRHAWQAHGMALSHEDALVLAFRAEFDAAPPSTMDLASDVRTEEEQP